MFHFIYKTYSSSGLYYYGRHTTDNLNDGYFGSGKWIRSIKDKSNLKRDIVFFCETQQELLKKEEEYISKYINDPKCMNFNEKSVGFSSINNPNKLLKGSKILSDRVRGEKNGMYGKKHTEEFKEHLRKMNSGKNGNFYGKKHTEEAKQKIRQKKIGKKFSPEVIEKLKKRFPGTSHPMSKLNETQIMEIYNLAWEGNLTQKQIAEMYDVRQGHVTKIKNGKIWSNITKHNNVL
jgi:DNA-binding MarR family transcriptional regulator